MVSRIPSTRIPISMSPLRKHVQWNRIRSRLGEDIPGSSFLDVVPEIARVAVGGMVRIPVTAYVPVMHASVVRKVLSLIEGFEPSNRAEE